MDFGERLGEMLRGPLNFRFLIQPLLAIVLGIRDGRRDHHAGRPPYFLSLFTEQVDRKERLRAGAKAIASPFVLALVLDSVVQVLLWGRLRLWSALVVGALLVALPYLIARGLVNRGMSRFGARRPA
jgi:hypothetical protein